MTPDPAGAERPVVLAIETSTPQGSVAWIAADGTVEQRLFRSDRSHNSALFPPLHELIDGRAAEIGLVLVGTGPGSYSGTRVGIAAAQGVALVASCPCAAIPSVLGTAAALTGPSLAVGDARRGAWWWMSLGDEAPLPDPELGDQEAFEMRLREAAELKIPVFSLEAPDFLPVPPGYPRPAFAEPTAARLHTAWLASGAAQRALWAASEPQPVYLRPPHITRPTHPRAWTAS